MLTPTYGYLTDLAPVKNQELDYHSSVHYATINSLNSIRIPLYEIHGTSYQRKSGTLSCGSR